MIHDISINETKNENKLPAWKLIFFGILLEEWMKYDVDGITVPPQVNSKTKSYRNANDMWVVG